MDKYVFIRDFGDMKKGCLMESKLPSEEIEPLLKLHILKLDPDLFINAHHSAEYDNWLEEKISDAAGVEITDEGMITQPLYFGVKKSPETLLMFLRDSGVSNSMIMSQMFGKENKYSQYLKVFEPPPIPKVKKKLWQRIKEAIADK